MISSKIIKRALIALVGAILIASVLSACCPCRKLQDISSITDSVLVNTEYKWRDTTIVVPGDTIRIEGHVNCDSLGRANLSKQIVKTGRAVLSVSVKDNKLVAVGGCPDLELKLQLKDKIIDRYKSRQSKLIEQIVTPKKLTGLQWFLILSGVIFWVLVIVLLIYHLK